ncbi:MAG: RNA-directed DNA polymerase [Saprospiraceae bacterium]|jgi:RNA-directed DNA polymerase
MKKSDKRYGIQMSLFDKEEWIEGVPVIDGVAVSYAEQGQVGEYLTGVRTKDPLTTNLLEQVIALPNLSRACKQVIANKGSAGVDKMTVKELQSWFSSNWQILQNELLQGTYVIQPVRTVMIPKPKGGERQLGIPTVKDRLVQQAISQVLNTIYEPTFSPTSYGFRTGRSPHDAIDQLSHYIGSGKTYIVDIDMAKFFDEVNHDRLMQRLRRRIADSKFLRLIHRYLKTGVLQGGMLEQQTKGTPQGSPLSPLLSNIVLDELDKELSKRGHHYVRYADDIIIAVGSQKSAERVESSVTFFIETTLKLKVNRSKSAIRRPTQLNYLGHGFMNKGEPILSKSSEQRLKNKIREITCRNRGRSFEQVKSDLHTSLRGWLNYFYKAHMKSRLEQIDGWMRRRLRCYQLKQCKRALGMMRFLHKLGISKIRAWTTATSRKGWWRKSLTPASHEGMNNEWFEMEEVYKLSYHYSLLHS